MKSIDASSVFKKYKYEILVALVSVLGFAIIMFSTHNYGAGLSPDSVEYIASARNIVSNVGYVSYEGTPIIVRPPLYPALLAFIGKVVGRDPLTFAHILNAVIFGLSVFVGGCLFFKHLTSFPAFPILGTLAILISPQLFKVSVMVWSEPLFILCVMLSIFFMNTYFEKRDIKSLFLLSLSVALSCLIRYSGISLILWGALIILFLNRTNLKNGMMHLSLFILISALPVGAWLIRNHSISGTFFGARGSSLNTLSQELGYVFNNLIYWYMPAAIANHRSLLVLVSVLTGFLVGISSKDSWQNVKVSLRQITPIFLFIIIYTAFLIISALTMPLEPISNRYLAPIYIPLTLLLLILVQAFVEPYQKRYSKTIMNAIMIIGISIWLVYPFRSTMFEAVNLVQNGLRYSSKVWITSETIRYLFDHQELESECKIYTNDPFAAYILANLVVKTSPVRYPYEFPTMLNDISKLRGSWPEENDTCLIWFDVTNRKDLFTLEELQTVANFTTINHLKDGSIYFVTRK